MDLVKDRKLEVGQKVKVYLNLHMKGRFSIQDHKTGLVVAYASSVILRSVEFKVSPSGQRRAREEQRRNVHAVAIGIFEAADTDRPMEADQTGYYNPFLVDTFVDEQTKQPIHETELAYCANKRVYYRKGMMNNGTNINHVLSKSRKVGGQQISWEL